MTFFQPAMLARQTDDRPIAVADGAANDHGATGNDRFFHLLNSRFLPQI
jgi:hypothetical protein